MSDNAFLFPQKLPYVPIGVAGHAGHGKDTLADILVSDYGYRKVSFAEPLRAFSIELFGLSPYFVLDRSAKERELCDHHWPFQTRSEFRAQLVKPLAQLLDVPPVVVSGHLNGSDIEDFSIAVAGGQKVSTLCRQVRDRLAIFIEPMLFIGTTLIQYSRPSPRTLLQVVGTEVFRAIHEDFWANIWRREACRYSGRVVASDVRFSSEIAAVSALGGLCVAVTANERLGALSAAKMAHPSEALVSSLPVVRTFRNDATPEALADAVRSWARMRLPAGQQPVALPGDPA